MMFFGGAAIAGVVAVFVFSIVFATPQAHAYAIGSAPGGGSGAGGAVTGYNFGASLQNLISPFTNFINGLKGSGNGMINVNGASVPLPSINLNGVSASVSGPNVQNLLSQWISQFDNWFYSVSGVQLSGIMVALFSLLLWVLGLAQQVVNWLVGLFH